MHSYTPTPRLSSNKLHSPKSPKKLRYMTHGSVDFQRKELPKLTPALKTFTVHPKLELTHAIKKPTILRLTPSNSSRFSGRNIARNESQTTRDEARYSQTDNGIVEGYGVNTSAGLFKTFNEDRVSIVYNIIKPSHHSSSEWPSCSYFAVFDGHGGSACADFLRDQLHHYIVKQSSFPDKPKKALEKAFRAAEAAWKEIALKNRSAIETSGSCALVMLTIGDTCYVANVGDSRAVLSADNGAKAYALTKDHKPGDEGERARIYEGGGEVYQSKITAGNLSIPGVHRVNPGRLSVSRTFGDIQAKDERYGGNHNVLIAEPDIRVFRVLENFDFIMLACDGIYDKLSNKEVVQHAWNTLRSRSDNFHKQCGKAADAVIKAAMSKKSMDNVTALLVAFNGFKKAHRSSVP